MVYLPTAEELKKDLPLSKKEADFVSESRSTVSKIFQRKDPSQLFVVGPCSIHDIKGALDFAVELLKLQKLYSSRFFFMMRVHLEKPRSSCGWRGFLLDPHRDSSFDIGYGLYQGRKLLLELLQLSLPISAEILDPFFAPYFSDLLSLGVIGARTSGSQTHRQLAAIQPYPTAFKNGLDGSIEQALFALESSRQEGLYPGLNDKGMLALYPPSFQPQGLILRGGTKGPNCSPKEIKKSEELLASLGTYGLIVDCAHGNSQKNPDEQLQLLSALITDDSLKNHFQGIMAEAHLLGGKKGDTDHPWLSITDPCLALEEISHLLFASESSPAFSFTPLL